MCSFAEVGDDVLNRLGGAGILLEVEIRAHRPSGSRDDTKRWPVRPCENARMREYKQVDTKAVHAGRPDPLHDGAVALPIYQSATFESHGDEKSYHDIKYARLSNTPTHKTLHRKLAVLEGAEAALVTSSGMAAISTTLFTILSAGDHLLAQSVLYGGTYDLIAHDFPKFGLAFDFIDADDASSWQSKLRPNTKAIYVEAMTNPLLNVADLRSVVT